MKDASYTIRAQLGIAENPFSTTGIAGNAARSTLLSTVTAQAGGTVLNPTVSSTIATIGSTSATTTPTSSTSSIDFGRPPNEVDMSSSGLSVGRKAGIGVGVSIGALIFIGIGLWVLRKKRLALLKGTPKAEPDRMELHGNSASIHEAEVKAYSHHEMAGHPRSDFGDNPRAQTDSQAVSEMLGTVAFLEIDGRPRFEVGRNSTRRLELE